MGEVFSEIQRPKANNSETSKDDIIRYNAIRLLVYTSDDIVKEDKELREFLNEYFDLHETGGDLQVVDESKNKTLVKTDANVTIRIFWSIKREFMTDKDAHKIILEKLAEYKNKYRHKLLVKMVFPGLNIPPLTLSDGILKVQTGIKVMGLIAKHLAIGDMRDIEYVEETVMKLNKLFGFIK